MLIQYHVNGNVEFVSDSTPVAGRLVFLEGKLADKFEQVRSGGFSGYDDHDIQLTGTNGNFDLRATTTIEYTDVRVVVVNNPDTIRSLTFPISVAGKSEIRKASVNEAGGCFSSDQSGGTYHAADLYTLFISTIFVP